MANHTCEQVPQDSDVDTTLPPYSPPQEGSSSQQIVVASPSGSRLPVPEVPSGAPINGLNISTMFEPIRGSWLLDPLAASASTPSIMQTIMDGRTGRRPRRFRNVTSGAPTAKLDSRRGNIAATFRVAGESATPATATIRSTTRSGNIVLELVSKASTRSVHIDAYSRQGNVTILVPRNFSGMVELRARRGDIDILPALVSSGRVVRSNDRETIVLLGDVGPVGDASSGDLARLYTRSGRVRLGFSGEDTFTESEGIIAQATQMFQRLTTSSSPRP
ncbi:hypothetical protein BC834DRAFT_840677 [Gloeopeniophorella convolvens]|nr:hypothetical protein BC834DRAFT_840677 [Gloeopeniophorella convolvens]